MEGRALGLALFYWREREMRASFELKLRGMGPIGSSGHDFGGGEVSPADKEFFKNVSPMTGGLRFKG
jgi:hypothetical protein